ncbi:MAG: type I-E CRISPR-associated protein Cas5/CasD [Pelistega sp.]|nr:type I-E CRISPR-associated protein Cas5/CasD [Pelistega sp.]
MQDYLVFRLYGALASWGVEAVGEYRATAACPTRSALLGFLAAALGIDRNDLRAQEQLSDSVFFGIKQLNETQLIRDFHTTHAPTATAKAFLPTRQAELRHRAVATILSQRDYVCEGVWHIAVWSQSATCPYTLKMIKNALINPKYTLYLGRKSCPLGVPLSPQLVTVANLKDALDIDFPSLAVNVPRSFLSSGKSNKHHYIWEGEKAILGVDETLIITQRSRHQPNPLVARQFIENFTFSFRS